ncbi:hypothetical protein BDQ17DRAFT_1390761 [Cyathus striatus]|nr:hypothetical protein BDQ17DRAFT_1390761 [Cyathus striatus]
MLTLSPGSACDVCAEEYGPHRQPHSIPCGHVLCASCCTKILEKTSSRLTPGCPFCRVPFTSDGIRIIRTDFYTSGWSTPRRFPTVEAHTADFSSEMLAKKTERLLLSEGCSRTRLEARRLEDKVAKVAAKKCSVEEVSTLHRELEDWLMSEVRMTSAALLRAILHNHLAHSEASKTAKSTEEKLTKNINDLNSNMQHLETELRRQRQQYQQKSEECQTLRMEANRLKALATTIGGSDYRPMSPTTPAPTPCTSPIPPATTPLSRFTSMHGRSASMSSRPSTPSSMPVSPTRSHTPAPPRSHTPAVPPRSHTPAATVRSHTPSLSYRSNTPAPPMPRYTSTPAPSHLRPTTPAPLVPPKPRRLSTSHSTPPKIMRSSSEEKPFPELWIPPGGTRPPSRAAGALHHYS